MNERSFALAEGTNIDGMSRLSYDVVVVGAGIAGMTVALNLDSRLRVLLVNKSEASDSSTFRAQGGIAVAVGPDDSPGRHMVDTLRVGQGLCRPEAVKVMAEEGPEALEFLQLNGVSFNTRDNGLDFTREAGHSLARVVHYYDYTGRQISQTLRDKVNSLGNVDKFGESFLVDIMTVAGDCCGCVLLIAGKLTYVEAQAVIVASGGYAGLFACSSNSRAAGGDGIAAAYRAGAVIADMEFVQFHPTTFTTGAGEIFLLTEALRGEGAVLRNHLGERFMLRYHQDAELAPRDEVSRAISREMTLTGNPVYLDARPIGAEQLKHRFRQVYAKLAENNIQLDNEPVPVAPAAHYTIGGILTDLWGKSSVGHLFACGEAAATGVHGANRLASNSLLEGVVFGRRVAECVNQGELSVRRYPGNTLPAFQACYPKGGVAAMGSILERAAGVVRSGEELAKQLDSLRRLPDISASLAAGGAAYRACNAFQLTGLILEAALLRRESRGTHCRADFPARNDEEYGRHVVQQWGKDVALGE